MKREEIVQLMKSSKNEEEWDKNCDKVFLECNGKPPYWEIDINFFQELYNNW